MPEDIKTKMMLPFKPPITITNETQPGEEEGEVVPVPIHIIVDNAADFPVCDCGGGGGGEKFATIAFPTQTIGKLKDIVSHGVSDPDGAFAINVANTDDIYALQSGQNDAECYFMIVLFSENTADENFVISVPTGSDLYIFVSCQTGGIGGGDDLTVGLYDGDSNELIQEIPYEHKPYYDDTMLNAGPFTVPEDLETPPTLVIANNR